MSIGPTVLTQTAEALRKIRNTARFALANIGEPASRSSFHPVPRGELGMAERYVMHKLHELEQTALDGYRTYNFPKGT